MRRVFVGLAVGMSAVLVVSACASATASQPAAFPASGVSGYEWTVSTISDAHGAYRYTAKTVPESPALLFRPDGEIEGSDGLNYLSQGHYRLTTHGYTVSGDVASTAEGVVDPDAALTASQTAIDEALDSGHDITATAAGTSLVIKVVGYKVTLHRAGPVAIEPRPSPT